MAYILEHTVLGFCWYDLIALAVLIGVVVLYIVKVKKMKKLQAALKEAVAATTAVPTVEESK